MGGRVDRETDANRQRGMNRYVGGGSDRETGDEKESGETQT